MSVRNSWLCAISLSIATLLFGVEIGIPNQVSGFKSVKALFNLADEKDKSNVIQNAFFTSTMPLGAIFGALTFAFFGIRLARKTVLYVASALFFVFCLLSAYLPQAGSTTTERLVIFVVFRVVVGFAIGLISSVVPPYITEISLKEKRGQQTSLIQLSVTAGIFLGAVINTIIFFAMRTEVDDYSDNASHSTYFIPFTVEAVFAFLVIAVLRFIPESPTSLMERKKYDECKKSLSELRKVPESDMLVENEYNELKKDADKAELSKEGNWSMLWQQKNVLKPVAIVCALQFFQQWTGINAVFFYSEKIFSLLGFGVVAKQWLAMLLALLNFLFTLPAILLVERFGRKFLLLWGFVALSFVCCLIGVSSWLAHSESVKSFNTAFGIVTVILLCVYIFVFAISAGPVVWTYQAEVIPLKFRTKGNGLGTLVNALNSFIVVWLFPVLQSTMKTHVFLLFGLLCCVASFTIYYCVKETKGLTIDEIQDLYDDKRKQQAADI